jgi:HD-GYP domain-containing protein (c-di-GMP phosphodiesterase class II)
MAAEIHDIGKMMVPAEILSRLTTLTALEKSVIQTHVNAGYEIISGAKFMHSIAETVYQHHERLDGSGYPRGLKGDEILLEAQIIGVADVVEAMFSHRPYRTALGLEAALNEIQQGKGTLYDARVVESCIRLFREKGFKFDS